VSTTPVRIGDRIDSVPRVYSDPAVSAALMETVLGNEHALAAAIGPRTGRSDDDLLVRVTANACVGAFRAAPRAAVVAGDVARLPVLVDEAMRVSSRCSSR
jgi:hypothetical protein